MNGDRLPLVTLALGIEETAEVTNRVDLPTRILDVALELTAPIPTQDQRLPGPPVSKDDSKPRPIHRIDQETNKGAALLIGQVNPKEVLQVPRGAGIELVLSIAYGQRRLLD